jgi:hypothetical protein
LMSTLCGLFFGGNSTHKVDINVSAPAQK